MNTVETKLKQTINTDLNCHIFRGTKSKKIREIKKKSEACEKWLENKDEIYRPIFTQTNRERILCKRANQEIKIFQYSS